MARGIATPWHAIPGASRCTSLHISSAANDVSGFRQETSPMRDANWSRWLGLTTGDVLGCWLEERANFS